VRETAFWEDGSPENDRHHDIFAQQIYVLTEAEDQIQTTGTISQKEMGLDLWHGNQEVRF
jgi:hypothetical protein